MGAAAVEESLDQDPWTKLASWLACRLAGLLDLAGQGFITIFIDFHSFPLISIGLGVFLKKRLGSLWHWSRGPERKLVPRSLDQAG